MIFEKSNVVAIFAHPDDAELTCFGTLAKLVESGSNVTVLDLSVGEGSTSPERAKRVAESQRAVGLAGITRLTTAFPDGYIKYDRKVVTYIENQLIQIRPNVVITHFPQHNGHGHQDHAAVSASVMNASLRLNFVTTMMMAEPPVRSSGFCPNLFIDVTQFMPLKERAIRAYRSEKHKDFMDISSVKVRGQWWGFQAGAYGRYVEPFFLTKVML